VSRDKIKIEDERVEVGTACEAYWEDSNNKGWFEAIILSFEGINVNHNLAYLPKRPQG
jgi:hypothetical protein